MDMHELMKNELLTHLKGGMAFMPLTDLLEKISFEKLGERPYNLPYSFYELFYHITYTQNDILKFMSGETYQEPKWPDGYWPSEKAPKDKKAWSDLKKKYQNGREEIEKIISSEERELLEPVKHATKGEQTHLRELLLVIQHTAYHTGQLLIVLRLLNLHA